MIKKHLENKKWIQKGKNFDIDFEALKKKELEILKNFITCCEKMNLTYYIGFGTLLGAIRHKALSLGWWCWCLYAERRLW